MHEYIITALYLIKNLRKKFQKKTRKLKNQLFLYKATNKKNCINDRLPQGKTVTSVFNFFFINLVEKITNDIHNFEKKK